VHQSKIYDILALIAGGEEEDHLRKIRIIPSFWAVE
jgi:hypothetical protein